MEKYKFKWRSVSYMSFTDQRKLLITGIDQNKVSTSFCNSDQ